MLSKRGPGIFINLSFINRVIVFARCFFVISGFKPVLRQQTETSLTHPFFEPYSLLYHVLSYMSFYALFVFPANGKNPTFASVVSTFLRLQFLCEIE